MDIPRAFPRISVITPSFRHAEFLEATIDSVLSQGYPNLEYIIVDGGSDDGSVEIIRKYASHLAFWCSERDGGQYDAINKGMARATGDILCWLNSDDMHYPWTLRTVGSIFSEFPSVEWLTTLAPGFWDREGYCLGFKTVPGYSRAAFVEGCYAEGTGHFMTYIQQESTFWRRDLWNKVGGLRPQYTLAADFDLWARFYLHAELYGVPSPLGGFRIAAMQRSQQADKYQSEALASLTECRQNMLQRREADGVELTSGIRPFHGKRIVRKGRDSLPGRWEIEEYTFS
jgi:glycosyltransferase involved in cell wall biosynthesis